MSKSRIDAGLEWSSIYRDMTAPQTMLTSKIRELLCKADINRGVLNGVPLDTVGALIDLRLVDGQWREGATADAASTHVDRVKLTAAGIQLACSIQGVEKVRCP